MVYFLVLPDGATTSILSPFSWPTRAAPTGDSTEMRCSRELVSVVPTMLNVDFLPFSSSSSTVVPMETVSVWPLPSTTVATERIWRISLMRDSFLDCSSLAASYSEFSEIAEAAGLLDVLDDLVVLLALAVRELVNELLTTLGGELDLLGVVHAIS